MKVPVPTSGRVIPKQQLAYVEGARNPSAGLEAVARGAQNLGESVTKLAATWDERDQKTDRFNSLTNFSKFQSDMAANLTELKRTASPDGKGYVKSAESLYDQKSQEYLSTVPQDLQDEFRYRVAENKRSLVADSLSFQYDAGDAWFKQGVSDELNKARTMLDQNPGALDIQRQHMNEVIDATDLPEITKNELKRNVAIGLETATYKAEVRKDASTRLSIGVGEISDFATGARALIKKEEGYVPGAMWDKNHHRVGYSSDTITNPDGSYRMVKEGDVTTREDAERDLTRRIEQADIAGRNSVGAERWNGLAPNVKAGLASVYYHYGKYPQEVLRAVETGSASEIASAVRGLSSNPPRREREAKIIEGSGGVEADPRFQNIPYEDRMALRDDADREAQQLAVAQARQEKELVAAKTNDLYLGLLDGRQGKADIDAARQAGWLTDYDSINKANEIIKNTTEKTILAGQAAEKLSSGAVFDPTDTEDKKRLNAYVGTGGLQKIQSGDEDYISNSLVPLVSKVGDIPTDVAGTLTGMLRANNAQGAMFALDALAQLRDTNELAFNQRVGSDVAAQVDMWDSQKDLATDQQELLNKVRGGTDQASRQAQMTLRTEAKSILSQTENGVPNSKSLLAKAVGEFGGLFSSPNTYTNPIANQSLEKEFSSLFIDKYSLTGNVDSAVELATKELQRNWGVTDVGNRTLLMKYPPEKVGYRAVNGSYNWIDASVRQDLQLPPTDNFELFSDEQTRQEFQAFQRDPNAPPPSYRIFTIDSDGVARERVDAKGNPMRLNFKPPQYILQDEADTFDRKAERFRVDEIIANYPRLQAGALASQTQVPDEDTQAYQEALKAREALDAADAAAAANRDKWATPQLDPETFPQFPPGSY